MIVKDLSEDDEHSLFLLRWEMVIVTYNVCVEQNAWNVWNKTLEPIFQITRGQWGTQTCSRSVFI